ncbi:hypothetical protein ATE71_18425 [Sphingopyxis sp. H115]|nr:hypothetical protein ATE71_18425 [Sphingopyxis sp. H115]
MTGNDHPARAGILSVLKEFLEDREAGSVSLTQDLLQAENVTFRRMDQPARPNFYRLSVRANNVRIGHKFPQSHVRSDAMLKILKK